MDVFELRERVVSDYRDYVESFINILDPRLDAFVREQLGQGELWPEAALQLNPAFQRDATLGELAAQGVIHRDTARFFGEGLRLYRHQRRALEIARTGASYVVTTGTGSGKSLTYLAPIYDAIVRNDPGRAGVRAIIVYPMNALINSQENALRELHRRSPGSPVTFAKYTGQTKHEDREVIIEQRPHIILTNYVMLEYLLTRQTERALLETATRDLQFLVLDELHVYRGRQGADVAMLLRRLQVHTGRPLQVIGTSATMATEGGRDQRRTAAASVATKLFGVPVPPDNVVDEDLARVATVAVPADREALAAAVQLPPPPAEEAAVRAHPLVAWIEETLGLETEGGRLVRRPPQTFEQVASQLEGASGLGPDLCRQRLQAALEAGNAARDRDGQPVLAFRLHQFLSSGGSVYATLEAPEVRTPTMDAHFLLGDGKVLFPLAFCRECGQEYYLVSRLHSEGGDRLLPRSPMVSGYGDETPGEHGYFVVGEDIWDGDDDDLPDEWFRQLRGGRRLESRYEEHRPQAYRVSPDGTLHPESAGTGTPGWFQPRPLLICLRCRAVYTWRDSEFRKLSSLSETGRSSATTVVVNATVGAMRALQPRAEEAKVLSFTDNRQDASLQAGHLNDFVQTVQVRAALVAALEQRERLDVAELGTALFDALALRPEDFLKEPVAAGPGFERGRRAMVDLLQYRALEDLGRSWRLVLPSLEQTGQLRIEYDGLHTLARDDSLWRGLPAIGEADSDLRERVLRTFLDHLRSTLAIDAQCLSADATRQMAQRCSQELAEPWALREDDPLTTWRLAILPGVEDPPDHRGRRLRLNRRSALARYLASGRTWDLPDPSDRLSGDEAENLVLGIVHALRGHLLTVERDRHDQEVGVRINAGALWWTKGDGTPAPPDPVRARALYLRRRVTQREPNRYFTSLYASGAEAVRGMRAREHTGQIDAAFRERREQEFREGKLPALFCSPTMELGIDIRDLRAVHLRNMPPTPANYAQRSGRAGRGGQPAFIAAFAAQGNAHDQYFFRAENRTRMIAGAVEPARMDLRNPDLVEAHIHALWLAGTRLNLGTSLQSVIDLTRPDLPLQATVLDSVQDPQLVPQTLERARRLIAATQEVAEARWYTDAWLDDVVRSAATAFDRAFDQWRDLYRSAVRIRDDATRVADAPGTSKLEREQAERRRGEARREIRLLLNDTQTVEESDFYPYRYLASVGFLPGYNFPRLPVRAFVRVGENVQTIQRPRFFAITEFGPRSVVYHEGAKHIVDGVVLSPAGLDAQLTAARLCTECGYAHENADAISVCEHCGSVLAPDSRVLRLLEQPAVRTHIQERITAEEEERRRQGYVVTTHYRFAETQPPRRALVRNAEGPLLTLEYAPASSLWRVNRGWRDGDQQGFTIDRATGRWGSAPRTEAGEADKAAAKGSQADLVDGVRTFVRDTRNILLVRPHGQLSESALITLLAALRRSVQLVFQVEDQEIAAELIGRGDHQRLLFWEVAEGGTGVWEELVDDPQALRRVARQALALCHYDPDTGEEQTAEACLAACYRCLLSYSNQNDHRFIDRRLVRDLLVALANSEVSSEQPTRTREELYAWLQAATDPASEGERRFLDFLYQRGYRLPDRAQVRPVPGLYVQPDFYYERDKLPGVCVFIDGAHHRSPEAVVGDTRLRAELQERGYRVVAVRLDQDLESQLAQHPDVFRT